MDQGSNPFEGIAQALGLSIIHGGKASRVDLVSHPAWPTSSAFEYVPERATSEASAIEGALGIDEDASGMIDAYFAGEPVERIAASRGLVAENVVRVLLLQLLDIEVRDDRALVVYGAADMAPGTVKGIVDRYLNGESISAIARDIGRTDAAVGWTLLAHESMPVRPRQLRIDPEEGHRGEPSVSTATVSSTLATPLATLDDEDRILLERYFAGETASDLASSSHRAPGAVRRRLLTLLTGVRAGFGDVLPTKREIEHLENGVGADLVEGLKAGESLRQAAARAQLSVLDAAWFLIASPRRLLSAPVTPETPWGATPEVDALARRSEMTSTRSESGGRTRTWTVRGEANPTARRAIDAYRAGDALSEIARATGLEERGVAQLLMSNLLGLELEGLADVDPGEAARLTNHTGAEILRLFDAGAELEVIATSLRTRPSLVAWTLISDPSGRQRFPA